MSTRWRLAVAVGGVLAILVGVAAAIVVPILLRDEPERFTDIRDHFRYGSYGSEARAGIPEPIWRVLPVVFEDLVDAVAPNRPGSGYERFGFIYEDGVDRPIGTTLRVRQVPLVGLNCAACHVGTVRVDADAEPVIHLGMPAHRFDLQSYLRFLFAAVNDERFTPDVLLRAIDDAGYSVSWLERTFYRSFVIPSTAEALRRTAADFAWFDARPDHGPGRVDTFNPYKAFWNEKFPGSFDLRSDTTIGTADLPSLWLQGPRAGMNLHWDGNNAAVRERNISAAIGSGASEASLEIDQLERIAAWIETLEPPGMPVDRIDGSALAAGEAVFDEHCARCHAFDGAEVGQVVPVDAVGTDPYRWASFGETIAAYQNRLGDGYPWALSRFRVTEGYANSPLDGLWLRAPYLHNGSVPSLFHLLEPPEDRPTVFYRGYDVYDFDEVGFVYDGAEAERVGFRFDTAEPGNGNGGHLYGTGLGRDEKDALLEYLKTL